MSLLCRSDEVVVASMTCLGPTEFADLLAAAQRGDGRSFERLLAPVVNDVAGYLRAQVSDDAEDLLQDVLASVYRALGRFEGGESQFRTWLFTCARHRVIDHRRTRRSAVPLGDRADRIRASDDVESEVVRRVTAAGVLALLDHLPELQRQVVLLRIVGQLDVAETAAVLGQQPGTVRVLQHRGLRQPARTLAEALTRGDQ
jgi:RNA polymerase sigma-70 factor (ECF subfamily)